MKPTTLIKVSVSFSLMLGIAAAAAIFYADDASALRGEIDKGTISQVDEPTSATIAAWKATARSSDYLSPRVPI